MTCGEAAELKATAFVVSVEDVNVPISALSGTELETSIWASVPVVPFVMSVQLSVTLPPAASAEELTALDFGDVAPPPVVATVPVIETVPETGWVAPDPSTLTAPPADTLAR